MAKSDEKEGEIQRAVLDYLAYAKVFHYRNNSGAMVSEYKGKRSFTRFGERGSPDIIVVIKGMYIGLEIKGTKGVQNENQKTFQERLVRAGGKYHIVRSLTEAQSIVTHYQP